MTDQGANDVPIDTAKAEHLRTLHQKREAFIIPNPWDAGSARLLEAAGFKALATTGAGLAYTMGKANAEPGRDAILQNAATIVDAVDLPVSADLENGFGDAPECVASTIEHAISIGLAGGSIEDASFRPNDPIFDIDEATDRIAAAAQMVKQHGSAFQLVARAENFLYGRKDLADTITRLQRYQDAGADVLYAPGLTEIEDIRAVIDAVDLPVNVVMGRLGQAHDMQVLRELGVARVSVGSALQRLAFAALETAAQEMMSKGTFSFAAKAISVETLDERFCVS